MRSTVVAGGATITFSGPWSRPSASSSISRGMVAENSSVCFLPRKAGEHPLHIMYKAHVQHTVGFVQYEYLNIFQVDIALSDEIVQAAGRGCQDIYALFSAGPPGDSGSRRRK